MASCAIHHSSSASRSLLRTTRWSILQGNIARCLSTKVTQTPHVIGSACYHGNRYDSATSQPPRFSLTASLTKTSEVKPSAVGKRQARLYPVSNLEVDFEKAFTRLTISPLESRLNAELMLPSVDRHHAKVILDPSPFASLLRDCPTMTPLAPLYDPLSNPNREIRLPFNENATKKHASNILHKRRRKMNRHQYLKWKKRNKFKLRIQKQRKQKKKRLKWEQHLAKFRFTGLKPGEGEEYLAKRRAKLAIFLRHLGIETDEEEVAKKTKMSSRVQKVGRVLPEPLLPEHAKTFPNN
ncbi:uncharacterized protein LOC119731774 [Patiria miniata]|uniref:Ribosomal protein mS38 C-terminal domain-containing protein n=1 Tax=Patiria miniata TaxID=46514 RepID=A0A914ABX2_PATMI|nr:uncharacterized protein LOC119731774 [Patiria miniata]XP_038060966.1 uncharacterized protein LOC119731774 [Patiria miniata]XP_038060967.1 uncharacterized protein LOC119731774 [Patiria miniata]